MDRADVHRKIDEVFDELDKYDKTNGDSLQLRRIYLEHQTSDDTICGATLVTREHALPDRPFISWLVGVTGLYGGHYDLSRANVDDDWPRRLGFGRWRA